MKPALPRFTADDAQRAHDEWGANCGPGAIAAICGLSIDGVRPHLGDFEQKGYTNPTLMYGTLDRIGIPWFHRRDKEWPAWGLVRIQWTGPWTRPGVPAKAAYRHTHWVGACRHENEIGVFDINMMNNGSGWGALDLWALIDTEDGKRVPCPVSKGLTFKRWVRELKRLGYAVDSRELRACDYGAPTIRKRLFVVARRDGRPITWAAPTHAKDGAGGLLPWRTAAECIDWELDCPSIFGRRRQVWNKQKQVFEWIDKPLAENTLKRVARGVMRYVVNAEKPFIVGVGGRMGQSPERPVDVPAQTITAKGDAAVVQPFIVGAGGPVYGGKPVPADQPMGAQTTENHRAVVQPFVAAYYGEGNGGQDRNVPIDQPLRTQTVENRFAVVQPFISRVDQTSAAGRNGIADVEEPLRTLHTANPFALIAPHVTKFRANSDGHRVDEPMHTVTANSFKKRPGGAAPIGLVSAVLVPRYGERDGQAPRARPVDEPMAAVVPTGNGGSFVGVSIGRQFGRSVGSPADEPLGATTAGGGGKSQLVGAFLAQHNTGMVGHDAREPVSTIVGKGCTQGLVEARAAILSHNYTSNTAGGNGDPEQPAKTITTGGHHAIVECALSAEDLAGAERVAAFIAKYYSAAEHGQPVNEPLHTATGKPRFALVTVHGWPIVDIGLRMLQPRELYRAQGFPNDYVIDGPGPNGKPMTKTAQVRMCGNSVCPPIAQAIAHALVFGGVPLPVYGAAD